MRISGRHYRSIWIDPSTRLLTIVDQTLLPYRFVERRLRSFEEVTEAIRTMRVRGAPLIGATAAHGLALALAADSSDSGLDRAMVDLASTRPTAINLRWALERVAAVVGSLPPAERAARALVEATAICDEDVASCASIGTHGHEILAAVAARRCTGAKGESRSLNILTHCNAGWLATVDWGTALAPIYKAHDAGLPVHVWVDETRPRNQGALLTAFELREHGVPHTVVVDNAGGHLMQRGLVDAVLVGSDRTTASGDVCNKIGTYLKALAAHENRIPFYVALPVSSIDWSIEDGFDEIPIEERDGEEVRSIQGRLSDGRMGSVMMIDAGSGVFNPAFDVTPARFVTGLITEHGVYDANREDLSRLREIARHEFPRIP